MLSAEFFAFMRLREQVRLNRAAGLPRDQWTDDEILKQYKFTNVKREHDHMTRYFKTQYKTMNFFSEEGDWQDRCDLFMTCAIFRYFGTEKSAEVLGPYSWARPDHRYGDEYFKYIDIYGSQGDLDFTGAYIIPNCGDPRPKYAVVADILRGIRKVHETIVEVLSGPQSNNSWKEGCEMLTSCWGVGSFMAKEILLDYILATGEAPSDWQTWTPVGPGARRGAARVLSADGSLGAPLSEPKALQVCKDLYDLYRQLPIPGEPHPYWPREFRIPLPNNVYYRCSGCVEGRSRDCDCPEPQIVSAVSLDLSDIQFQLCEFDKYMRAKRGEGRPKTKFVPRK